MTQGNIDSVSALVNKAGQGDVIAADQLLEKYRPYLRIAAQKAMRQMFQTKFDASDVVQQTCLEVFSDLSAFRGKSEPSFNAWITRILNRNIANFMRTHTAQKRDVRRETDVSTGGSEISIDWNAPSDSTSGPESRLIKGEAAFALASALSNLSEGQRIAVQMRFIEGCKLAEIASYMDISIPSVSGLLDRGLESLRRTLPTELT